VTRVLLGSVVWDMFIEVLLYLAGCDSRWFCTIVECMCLQFALVVSSEVVSLSVGVAVVVEGGLFHMTSVCVSYDVGLEELV